MRDFTTNNYCDLLWINDLLALKRPSRNVPFNSIVRKNKTSTSVKVDNVSIFGTIVEVKQIGAKGFLYHVDDGTGVIGCKHSEEQFEEVISVIETEYQDVLNETLQSRHSFFDQTLMTDTSADDSVFNDRSIQVDEADVNKRSRLTGLQSIWDDVYKSFSSLIGQYNIGDSVFVQGKLYSYFNVNQIYVNSIRLMDFPEEIIRVGIKLQDGYDPLLPAAEDKSKVENRLSGLMTFDNITHLNPKFPNPRNLETPKGNEKKGSEPEVVTPHLDSTITFDTFESKM